MNFNDHSKLAGEHSFLSASNYHWINYDDEKLATVYHTRLAAMRGTELHEFAATAIRLGQKLQSSRKTLNMYVNDAIGYKMSPEVILFHSYNAFCTADAISFRRNLLRIHDLKTGVTKASFTQLEVYAAYFCLEYGVNPGEIEMELRIYQNDDVREHIPDTDTIAHIMDKIISHDQLINKIRMEMI